MILQSSIRESTGWIDGINVLNGRKNRVRFHPSEENKGLSFLVNGEEILSSLDKAFLHKPLKSLRLASCISIDGQKERAVMVEHVCADVKYGLGIDNLVIELSDGVCPRFDYDNHEVFETLRELKLYGSSKRVYHKVRDCSCCSSSLDKKVKVNGMKDELRVIPSRNFYVVCRVDFPHKVIDPNEYIFRGSEKEYKEKIMDARAIFFMPSFIPESVLRGIIKPFFGVDDKNSLLIGSKEETEYRNRVNPNDVSDGSEFVRHKVKDALGEIALSGMNFKETYFLFNRTGHEFDIYALRTLIYRNVFEEVN